jgi:hypothetical protein
MTSAPLLGGTGGLIIVGHLESRWMSDTTFVPYKTVQQIYHRYDDNGVNGARRESVRVKTLYFRG